MGENLDRTETIEIKGRKFTMSFDMNAMMLLEEEFKMNPFDSKFYQYLFGKLDDSGNESSEERVLWPSEVIKLFYAFISSEHEEMTKRDIGKLIDLNNFKDVFRQMITAFERSMPTEEEKEDTNKPKTAEDTEQKKS